MRLVVTGSSGQIGTNLVLRCLARGHDVLGVDLRPNGWSAEVPTATADLRAPLAGLVPPVGYRGDAHRRPDLVVHLAAHAKVHALVERPALALENVAMTQHALELCRANGAAVVLASSREVYGDADRRLTREDDARVDAPTSAYAASKLAGEALVRAYGRSYGMRWAILRLSNVYGRFDDDLARLERVVPLFVREIAAGRPVTVYDAGKVLDFTWIDDCVDGIVAALEALHAGTVVGETFNLARGEGRTLPELAEAAGRALGVRPSVIVAPRRAGEIGRYVADVSRARARLGFEPRVSLDEGVRRVVAARLARDQAFAERPATKP